MLDSVVMGKNKDIVKAVKKAVPSMGGGAVGGLLAGAVLSTAVEGASKLLKKEAGVVKLLTGIDPPLPVKLLEAGSEAGVLHAGIGGALNYGTPGCLFAKTRLGRWFQKKTRDRQANALAVGIKEGIAGRKGVGYRASLFGNLTMPELLVPRVLGQDIGRALRKLPPEKRETVLRAAKHYVRIRPHLRFNPRTGEPTPVLNYLEEGVDKALGNKRMFGERGKLKSLLMKAYYGKRGISKKGLPDAGPMDKPTKIGKYEVGKLLVPAGLAAGGFASLVTNPIPGLTPHVFIGGLKGSLPYAPFTSDMLAGEAKKEVKKGILRGLFPNMKRNENKTFSFIKRYLVTPSVDDVARIAESGTNEAKRVAMESLKPISKELTKKSIQAKRRKLRRDVLDKTTKLTGAGLAAGAGAAALEGLK